MPRNTIKIDNKLHKLKYWRGMLGLKQDDVAVLIGCKSSNYSSKENGKVEIFLSEQKKIKTEFNKRLVKNGMPELTLDELFG